MLAGRLEAKNWAQKPRQTAKTRLHPAQVIHEQPLLLATGVLCIDLPNDQPSDWRWKASPEQTEASRVGCRDRTERDNASSPSAFGSESSSLDTNGMIRLGDLPPIRRTAQNQQTALTGKGGPVKCEHTFRILHIEAEKAVVASCED